jgi:gliding motility-associated-like protein
MELPDVNLGNDTVICYSNVYILNAGAPHLSYLWNDASTYPVRMAHTSGEYSVEVTNIYTTCKNSDTVNVLFPGLPDVDLGNDTSFCSGTSYLLNVWHEAYSYLWQDHSSNPYFVVYTPGTYSVTVKNQYGCTNADTVQLSLEFPPYFQFPSDTLLCDSALLNLGYDFDDTRYLWQDGSTGNSFLVSEPGEYILNLQNACGSMTDSIRVDYRYCGEIRIPNVITPNGDDVNDLFKIKGIEDQYWALFLFNRWGTQVRYFPIYDNTWDGTDQNGRKLSDGVYYFRLINNFLHQSYKGTVRIIR